MFRFEHSIYLYALLLIPTLVALFVVGWRMRQRALDRFGDAALIKHLVPQFSKRGVFVRFALLMLALGVLVIGWANPQWGATRREVKRQGIDLFVALDISQSMLAEDITPNRLERAKRFAQSLVDELAGNNTGVIFFTCDAFMAAPLTTDYAFAQLSIASAHPDQAGVQGTALSSPIELAERSFREDSPNHRALVILSDGEDHNGSGAEAAAQAHEQGTLVFTVGVGRPEGSFIPVSEGGISNYLRDQEGNPIRTTLDEEGLRKVAEAGGGAYFNLANNSEELLESLRRRIESIEKREFEQRSFTDFASYFQYFIALAALLLVLEWFASAGAWSRKA